MSRQRKKISDVQAEGGLSLSRFIEHSPIAIAQLADDGTIADCNAAFHTLTHNHFPQNPSQQLSEAVASAEERIQLGRLLDSAHKNQSVEPVTLTLNLDGNRRVIVSTYATCIVLEDDTTPVMMLYMTDLTEQKNLEMRFAHSQKMQAVGQLAGGVAHDFNNLLTAMIGFCDLLLMRHPAGDPSFADIMQIKQNANRAANLVRQLLAFSRRQTLQPKVIDLTDVLAELSNLIRRLIGENIELDMIHGRDLGMVKADQGQLEQVVINLAVNARDAMPEGGALTIRTSNVTIERPGPPQPGMISPEDEDQIVPGDYVLVEMQDSGTGIPEHIVKNIFEPFFSTKEIGSGTGLGLSTVYGIIKQTGGYVYITSRQDEGTTFSLYFKRFERPEPSVESPEEARMTDLTGGETILLVEDETPVRIFAARALRNKGYEVLEADSGESAITVFEGHDGRVDVIISDVVMPGINGPKMVEQLHQKFPAHMKTAEVIFISGYAENAFIDSFGPDREFNFLAKPFTLKQLAAKVKEVVRKRAVE